MSLIDDINKKKHNDLTEKEWAILCAEENISARFCSASTFLTRRLESVFSSNFKMKEDIKYTSLGDTLYIRNMIFSSAWFTVVFDTINDLEQRLSYVEKCMGCVEREILSTCRGLVEPANPNFGLPVLIEDFRRLMMSINKVMALKLDTVGTMQLVVNEYFDYIRLSDDYLRLFDGVNVYELVARNLLSDLKEFHASLSEIINKYKLNELEINGRNVRKQFNF